MNLADELADRVVSGFTDILVVHLTQEEMNAIAPQLEAERAVLARDFTIALHAARARIMIDVARISPHSARRFRVKP